MNALNLVGSALQKVDIPLKKGTQDRKIPVLLEIGAVRQTSEIDDTLPNFSPGEGGEVVIIQRHSWPISAASFLGGVVKKRSLHAFPLALSPPSNFGYLLSL